MSDGDQIKDPFDAVNRASLCESHRDIELERVFNRNPLAYTIRRRFAEAKLSELQMMQMLVIALNASEENYRRIALHAAKCQPSVFGMLMLPSAAPPPDGHAPDQSPGR